MRVFIWTLVFLLAAVPRYCAAQAGESDHHVTCADHYADWQSGFAPPLGVGARGTVPPLPRGARTRIFTCLVGGHRIVMKYALLPSPLYHCGAATNGWISAWVDGTPVVKQHQWGDYDSCMAGEDEPSSHIINRVLINDRLHMTICEQVDEYFRDKPFAPADLLPGQTVRTFTSQGKTMYTRSVGKHCELRDIRLDSKARPVKIARTPPGLVLVVNRSPICTEIGRHLVYFPDKHGNDRSLAAWRIQPIDRYEPVKNDLDHDGRGDKTFTLDVDNDGVPDQLIRHIFYSDTVPNQFSWVSGRTGQRHDITGSALYDAQFNAMPGNWPDPVLSTLHFIKWRSRTYLYLTMVAQNDALPTTLEDYETEVGASPGTSFSGQGISRRIFALKADGSATNLCNWSVRKRPEEFL